jgi:flagellar L-ring protein precursor FlgH
MERSNRFFEKEKTMHRETVIVLLLTAFVLCAALPTADCQAGSIWAKREKNFRDPYADDVARSIGDVLTIKISEASTIDNKAKRDLKKETDRSTTFNGELNIDHILPKMPGLTMSAESSNELKSKADYKDERKFIDKITVVVVDILPNRNLVVLGTRNRSIAGDIQTLEISGIVRVSDIEFDNTVDSERVAAFRIITKCKGVAAPYNKQGWLGRLFDVVWPF